MREKARDPKLVSCCPERKPLNIDQWRFIALGAADYYPGGLDYLVREAIIEKQRARIEGLERLKDFVTGKTTIEVE